MTDDTRQKRFTWEVDDIIIEDEQGDDIKNQMHGSPLNVRRSISNIIDQMTEQHKARWFVLNEIEAGPGLDAAIEAALDDGVDAEDVLSSLVEAMMQEDDDAA